MGQQTGDLTWKELVLWLACFYSGADKGNPHVLGCYIVLVRATEDIDVRAAVDLQSQGDPSAIKLAQHLLSTHHVVVSASSMS